MDYKILSVKDYFTVGYIQILEPSRKFQCHGNFHEENADRIWRFSGLGWSFDGLDPSKPSPLTFRKIWANYSPLFLLLLLLLLLLLCTVINTLRRFTLAWSNDFCCLYHGFSPQWSEFSSNPDYPFRHSRKIVGRLCLHLLTRFLHHELQKELLLIPICR